MVMVPVRQRRRWIHRWMPSRPNEKTIRMPRRVSNNGRRMVPTTTTMEMAILRLRILIYTIMTDTVTPIHTTIPTIITTLAAATTITYNPPILLQLLSFATPPTFIASTDNADTRPSFINPKMASLTSTLSLATRSNVTTASNRSERISIPFGPANTNVTNTMINATTIAHDPTRRRMTSWINCRRCRWGVVVVEVMVRIITRRRMEMATATVVIGVDPRLYHCRKSICKIRNGITM
mmetsp:Transcript_79051/g.118859  ORF Transcript_79051/g.118859 Transcript_79051/m.118859 type:complete len:237 (-) Transcript_79051:96-806(-)